MREKKSNSSISAISTDGPQILTRDQHPVSRQHISSNALKVLYRLNKSGFDAYLVGGGVRDIMLGLTPKDFDIATNATPEQIKGLFRNCRLIGRRFRLAHIVFGRDVIEVATFRGHHDNPQQAKNCGKTSKQSEHGMLLRDNIYGSIEEDAERRDFTINALYYSIADFKVYDFANGAKDIAQRKIRLIGDPETRYREDPVRMLRAIRFATKLDMAISKETEAPIVSSAPLLENIPPARLFEEFLKLFLSGKAVENYTMLRQYALFRYFFPTVEEALVDKSLPYLSPFIAQALSNTDDRINNEKRVTPAFLFAAMLWYPIQQQIKVLKQTSSLTPQDAFFAAYGEIMGRQQQSIAIPKRFQTVIKDILILQDKLARREGKKAFRTFEHPKFRAGYDFLLLRHQVESAQGCNDLAELVNWWTEFQQRNYDTQQQMVKTLGRSKPGARRSPRKRRRPRTNPPQD
ncbi:polynucleotide adenylyltransferase PcnB [Thalassotalea sp. 1_MG-2023]|uniref:polynucleotide adenylyltransferase PcnB n=1 Tax=Thalassotalea sp. 1_MG-2023 TaxID=3062680 RepID=UPI0026E202D7|nr:polynucleotide adenylyltransferase PcnB [Thalassotalea sp. 1_MG-2023]MDO6425835.1 polynucleotide adenylyltransferase PcnB [Thalassotalea sp. 1_MG-2023]